MLSAHSTAMLSIQCINSSWTCGAARDISSATQRRVSKEPLRQTWLIIVSPVISGWDLCYLHFLSGGKERNYFSEYRYFLLPLTAQLITFTNPADGIHVTIWTLEGYSLPSGSLAMFLLIASHPGSQGNKIQSCWNWTSWSCHGSLLSWSKLFLACRSRSQRGTKYKPAFQLLLFPFL